MAAQTSAQTVSISDDSMEKLKPTNYQQFVRDVLQDFDDRLLGVQRNAGENVKSEWFV